VVWLPPVALAAVCADAALAKWLENYRGWRLGVAALMVCVPLLPCVKMAGQRQTTLT